MNDAYLKLLSKIEAREKSVRQGGSDYVDFENDVHQLLSMLFPHSILQSVRLFSPSQSKQKEFGLEMDNLFHIKHGGFDYIISVEVKNQSVEIESDDWICKYAKADGTETRKKVNEQISNHIKLLNEYLSPVASGVELKFMSLLVSSDSRTRSHSLFGYKNSPLILTSARDLYTMLNHHFNLKLDEEEAIPEFRRVTQSRFLSLLRIGQAIPELGHPELQNAIRYAERCRRDLDTQIFQDFDPTPDLWAINGSAGMGKSVLLAYTACVLASGYELAVNPIADREEDKIFTKDAKAKFEKMGLLETYEDGTTLLESGEIGIMAMSQKQLDSLKDWYQYFVNYFQSKDVEGKILFKRPYFFVARLASDLKKRRWSALLVDEAHDLSEKTELVLASEHLDKQFYLCVACDRHQKLKHVEEDARLVKGLSFSRKTKRLKQIYRNPAPIYIASLGLMFRWFNRDSNGPVVLPRMKELSEQFGFVANGSLNLGYTLSMKNDAHPANSWSHTVASFPDVNSAFQALHDSEIGRKEVLWVRFSREDPAFDYEKLQQNFTYHNCRTREAGDLSDKYIKGQDFQVVVIEGFPGFMDNYENEAQMWQFRRELYLCASRATCFLYFICTNIDNEEGLRIRAEIDELVKICANPSNPNSGGTKEWKFRIPQSDQRRQLKVFTDTDDVGDAEEGIEDIEKPVTVVSDKVASDNPVAPKEAVKSGLTEVEDSKLSIEELDIDEPDVVGDGEDEGHGLQWEITLEEIPSVATFASLMEVEEIAIIEILKHKYKMIATSTTPLPIVTASKLAAEEYDCYIIDKAPKPLSDIAQKKKEALDLFIEKNEPKSRTQRQRLETKDQFPKKEVTKKKREPEKLTIKTKSDSKSDAKVISLKTPIIISELADAMGLKPFHLMADLIKMEVFLAPHQAVEPDIAMKLCEAHGFNYTREKHSKT